ncbi:hypothetical protein C1X90_14815 [Pseudomonas sp. GP01-A9]|nr:hypothetical protein C1X90_14815 [Pseudomonas sp. GP01-A9]
MPAMQTTRFIRHTEVMPSPASQLLHVDRAPLALAFDLAFKHSSRPVGRCAVDLLLILILGTPSLGEVPSGGARAFCLLLRCSKVSRCKSGTNTSHHPNNGYAP